MKPRVLIVDDEDFSPVFMKEFLGDRFDFDYAGNGKAALTAVAAGNPAVILMDVEMPGGMNGYQACRALKDNKATQNIPVIFISAHTRPEDRLKAYESGGDDYVSKPFNVEELRHKISLALANQEKRNELAEKAARATNVAMMSLREAADSGVVLGFLSDIIRQSDFDEIAAATLRTLQRFRIEGAVQLRSSKGRISRNSAGACTPVEDAVLTEMGNDARIVDLGKRSAFNYERATIIVYDMPLQDPELYGRLKDTVVKMVEALDVHMRSLESVGSAIERGDTLSGLLRQNARLARELIEHVKTQRDDGVRNLKQIAEKLDQAGDAADLSSVAKLQLRGLANDTRVQAQAAHEKGLALEKAARTLLAGLDEPQQSEAPAQAKATPDPQSTRFNNVELF